MPNVEEVQKIRALILNSQPDPTWRARTHLRTTTIPDWSAPTRWPEFEPGAPSVITQSKDLASAEAYVAEQESKEQEVRDALALVERLGLKAYAPTPMQLVKERLAQVNLESQSESAPIGSIEHVVETRQNPNISPELQPLANLAAGTAYVAGFPVRLAAGVVGLTAVAARDLPKGAQLITEKGSRNLSPAVSEQIAQHAFDLAAMTGASPQSAVPPGVLGMSPKIIGKGGRKITLTGEKLPPDVASGFRTLSTKPEPKLGSQQWQEQQILGSINKYAQQHPDKDLWYHGGDALGSNALVEGYITKDPANAIDYARSTTGKPGDKFVYVIDRTGIKSKGDIDLELTEPVKAIKAFDVGKNYPEDVAPNLRALAQERVEKSIISSKPDLRTTPTPITWDVKTGLGEVPWNREVAYRGFELSMLPSEFRKLVPKGATGEESAQWLEVQVKQGKPLAPPFLEAEWDATNKVWKVSNHEGRSRSDVAAKLSPDSPIPVHIFPSGGMRTRHITEEMRNAPFVPQNGGEAISITKPNLELRYEKPDPLTGGHMWTDLKTGSTFTTKTKDIVEAEHGLSNLREKYAISILTQPIKGDVRGFTINSIHRRVREIDRGWRDKYTWEEYKQSPEYTEIADLLNIQNKIESREKLSTQEAKSITNILTNDWWEEQALTKVREKFGAKTNPSTILLSDTKIPAGIRALSEMGEVKPTFYSPLKRILETGQLKSGKQLPETIRADQLLARMSKHGDVSHDELSTVPVGGMQSVGERLRVLGAKQIDRKELASTLPEQGPIALKIEHNVGDKAVYGPNTQWSQYNLLNSIPGTYTESLFKIGGVEGSSKHFPSKPSMHWRGHDREIERANGEKLIVAHGDEFQSDKMQELAMAKSKDTLIDLARHKERLADLKNKYQTIIKRMEDSLTPKEDLPYLTSTRATIKDDMYQVQRDIEYTQSLHKDQGQYTRLTDELKTTQESIKRYEHNLQDTNLANDLRRSFESTLKALRLRSNGLQEQLSIIPPPTYIPYQTDWFKPMVRDAVRKAVEEGKPGISFTPADIQNVRNKKIANAISWAAEKTKDGYVIDVKFDNTLTHTFGGNTLSEALKDMRGQVTDSVYSTISKSPSNGKAKGQFPTTPFYENLYDKSLPKMIKNEYGQELEKVRTSVEKPNTRKFDLTWNSPSQYNIVDIHTGNIMSTRIGTINEANIALEQFAKKIGRVGKTEELYYLHFTPEIIEKVMKGQRISSLKRLQDVTKESAFA